MQGSASTAVWHVDAAEQGDDDLGTSQRIIGRGNMQRGLPVLVPCVDVSGVVDQDSHYFLKHSVKDRVISLVFVYWKTACDQLINITWDSGRLMSNVLSQPTCFNEHVWQHDVTGTVITIKTRNVNSWITSFTIITRSQPARESGLEHCSVSLSAASLFWRFPYGYYNQSSRYNV